MSGNPGSGRTTIARQVGVRYGAVVLHLDVVKTAVLEGGVDVDKSGRAAYAVLHALARDLVG